MEWLRTITLDLRSLGLFRIILGLNLIYDVLWKWLSIGDFVGVRGVFDVHFLQQKIFFTGNLHTIIGYFPNQVWVYIFLIISLVLFGAYTLGIKTRISSILSFFCYLNICDANLFLVVGYQNILIVLLGWSIFLPLDGKFALWPDKKQIPILPLAVVGILLQISLIYFIAAFAKNGVAWQNATAIDMVLSSKFYQKSTALWLLQYPTLTHSLCYLTLLFEYSIPLLLFLPWGNNKGKLVAAVLIVLFHWGLYFFIDVGNFHLVSLCTASVLLPAAVWGKKIPLSPTLPILSINAIELKIRNVLVLFVLLGVFICSLFQLQNFRPAFVPDFTKNSLLSTLKDAYLVHSRLTLFFRQRWSYFAPDPSPEMGWLKMAGQQNDYTWINLKNGIVLDDDVSCNNFYGAWKHIAAFALHRSDIPHSRLLIPRWLAFEVENYNKTHNNNPIPYAGAYIYSLPYDSLKNNSEQTSVIQLWEGFVRDVGK